MKSHFIHLCTIRVPHLQHLGSFARLSNHSLHSTHRYSTRFSVRRFRILFAVLVPISSHLNRVKTPTVRTARRLLRRPPAELASHTKPLPTRHDYTLLLLRAPLQGPLPTLFYSNILSVICQGLLLSFSLQTLFPYAKPIPKCAQTCGKPVQILWISCGLLNRSPSPLTYPQLLNNHCGNLLLAPHLLTPHFNISTLPITLGSTSYRRIIRTSLYFYYLTTTLLRLILSKTERNP